MIPLAHGTLPSTSFLAIHARITGTEAMDVLAIMRRTLDRGAHETLRTMLAAYGFCWSPPSPVADSPHSATGSAAPTGDTTTAGDGGGAS